MIFMHCTTSPIGLQLVRAMNTSQHKPLIKTVIAMDKIRFIFILQYSHLTLSRISKTFLTRHVILYVLMIFIILGLYHKDRHRTCDVILAIIIMLNNTWNLYGISSYEKLLFLHLQALLNGESSFCYLEL